MFKFITIDEEFGIICEALEKVTSRKEHYTRVLHSLRRNPGAWNHGQEEFKPAFVELFYSQRYKSINLKTCKGLGLKGIEILDRAYDLLNV